jgi:hypothetical protein
LLDQELTSWIVSRNATHSIVTFGELRMYVSHCWIVWQIMLSSRVLIQLERLGVWTLSIILYSEKSTVF